jgi:Copper binding proteins, plastocyanin/azurin family.
MGHESFGRTSITIPRGGTVTFVNNSAFLHIVGPGRDGRVTDVVGAPAMGSRGLHMFQSGDRYTTATWNTPGSYAVTCSLHPDMTMRVTVTG